MKKQKGYISIIEVMIVLAIIGIIAAVAVPAYQQYRSGGNVSSQTQCIGGYTFTRYSYQRAPTQIIDEYGHGIPCNRQ